jgi:hypothetical protein
MQIFCYNIKRTGILLAEIVIESFQQLHQCLHMYYKFTILQSQSKKHKLIITFYFRVPNAKAGRDQVDINVYGMEGVPAEVIEERLNLKLGKKRQKLEKELK